MINMDLGEYDNFVKWFGIYAIVTVVCDYFKKDK